MGFIDMHCDSLAVVMATDRENADLYRCGAAMVDMERMKKAGQTAQFFAVFLPPPGVWERFGLTPVSDEEYIRLLRDILFQNTERYSGDIRMAFNADGLLANRAQGKMSAVLTMEDGRAAAGKLKNIKRFYDMGFRAISLTWNAPNCFGAPHSRDPAVMQAGLTPFGREAVVYMQELGILVDVSHLSDGGFSDVSKLCKKPFVATHSNSRALCGHTRNLTDEQLRTLGNAGGVAGLNYGPEFLNREEGRRESTAAMIAAHARHMADVGGVDCVGLGSDFDGIKGNLEICDSTEVWRLAGALKREGFTAEEIEKIFYKNVLRVMADAMR